MTAPAGWEFEEVPGGPSSAPNPWFTRSERFIYDGVRRIQEIVTDPILADGEGNRVATMSFENETRNSGGGGGQASVLPTMSVFLRAQYVWGPGDGPANGVDELLCQIDPYASGGVGGVGGVQGKPWFILTDAQGDVVSIVGVAQDLSGNQVASVAGQWTYSPYGEVLTYDELAAHPSVVFGHKTLAIDRLDGPTLTWQDESEPGGEDWSFFETRRLEPGARLLAYARNRTLDIDTGRWLQEDPNAAGTTTLATVLYHGHVPSGLGVTIDLQRRVGDGLNIFECFGGNPLTRRDPLGLYMEPSEAVGLGIAVKRLASELVGEYSFNLELDSDWASDWTQGDSDHTRMNAEWVDDILTSFIEENVGEYDDGPAMGAGLVTTLVKGGKLARAGRAAWTAAQAALEMHHLISMFMGGMSSGAKVPIPMQAHRGEGHSLHNALGQLCKDTWGVHPNGPGGGAAIQKKMNRASLGELQKFRNDYFRILNAYEPGAAAKARKELQRQRKIMRAAGRGLRGFLR